MKVATCIVFLCACILYQASAQQNWWERAPDGSTTISASRTTTAAPTPAPPAPTNCPCQPTPEYNPVCGDDKRTYNNPGELDCARSCGRNVQLLFHGRCEKVA